MLSTYAETTRTELQNLVTVLDARRLPVPQETYAYDTFTDDGKPFVSFIRVRRAPASGNDNLVGFDWTDKN